MKITHSELVQIINEEVQRYKKIKLLESRKKAILHQLNEMKVCQECGSKYEESMQESMDETMYEGSDQMVDEILGKLFGKVSPEQKREEMKTFINSHPTYRHTASDVAEKFGKDEKQIFEKLVDFFAKEGTLIDGGKKIAGIKSFVYDPKSDQFMNQTKVSAPYGPMSGKAEL